MGALKDKGIITDRERWVSAMISLRELHSYAFNNPNESDSNYWPMMQSASIVIDDIKALLMEVKDGNDTGRTDDVPLDAGGS